jgi:hypothetical protein
MCRRRKRKYDTTVTLFGLQQRVAAGMNEARRNVRATANAAEAGAHKAPPRALALLWCINGIWVRKHITFLCNASARAAGTYSCW